MVILKKIRSSTLIETLVATVLIVIVFMMVSMILNNLFSNTMNNDTQAIENHLNELQYLNEHKKLQLPYLEEYQNWSITISKYKENNSEFTEFEAINLNTQKTINLIRNEN